MRKSSAGASLEVLRHHGMRHRDLCGDAGAVEIICGEVIIITCARCGSPVFVVLPPESSS